MEQRILNECEFKFISYFVMCSHQFGQTLNVDNTALQSCFNNTYFRIFLKFLHSVTFGSVHKFHYSLFWHYRLPSSACKCEQSNFTSLLYCSEANDMPINHVQKHLFVSKMRALQNLPPTKEALHQHCLRASYQAGQIWGRAFAPDDIIPAGDGEE